MMMIKCSKENHSPFLNLNSSKKEIHVSPQLIKENFYKLKLDTGFKADSEKGISWTPDWENPEIRKVNDSVSYVYFKFKGTVQRDGKTVPIAEMNAATFLMVKNGKEFYRAFYQSSTVNSKNSVPEYNKLEMQTFTGSLILSNLESKRHYKLEYTNGQLNDSYRRQGNKPTTNKLMSVPGSVSSWEKQCYTTIAHCTFVSDYYSRCGGEIMVLYSASCIWPNQICGVNFSLTDYNEVDICQDIWFPDPPTESGGGGGTGGEEAMVYLPIVDVYNHMSNACLSTTFNNLKNNGINNKVSDILFNIFGKSQNLELYFDDVPMADGNLNGRFVSCDPQQDGSMKLYIELNENTLPSASREYTTITILHEAVHAYLALSNETSLLDHEETALKYRAAMASALRSIYGTPQTTADALAWQGLFGTSIWNTFQSTFPTLSNSIRNINVSNHSGTSGTTCN